MQSLNQCLVLRASFPNHFSSKSNNHGLTFSAATTKKEIITVLCQLTRADIFRRRCKHSSATSPAFKRLPDPFSPFADRGVARVNIIVTCYVNLSVCTIIRSHTNVKFLKSTAAGTFLSSELSHRSKFSLLRVRA